MVKGKNSVPDRWHNYQPLHKRIDGTRFMPIKVPLKKEICACMTNEQRFMPADLLRILTEKNLKLGLIIDLTFTTRYYNPEEFKSNGISYEKVATAGQQIPSNEVVQKFSKIVKDFEDANENNDSVIAVHCTHGVNRSGYLICRYMIENLSFSPDDAIKGFKEARGYGIEREHYLASLRDLSSTTGFDTSEETREEQCKKRTKISPVSYFETDTKRHCRWADRHNDRPTDRHNRRTERHHNEWTERQHDEWTDRQHEKRTDRHNRQTARHHNEWTERQNDGWADRQNDGCADRHSYTTRQHPSHSTRKFQTPEHIPYQQRDVRYNYYPQQSPRKSHSRDYHRDRNESENCTEFFRFHSYSKNQGKPDQRNWQISENHGHRKRQRTYNDRR